MTTTLVPKPEIQDTIRSNARETSMLPVISTNGTNHNHKKSRFHLSQSSSSKIRDDLSGLPAPYFNGDFKNPNDHHAYKAFMETIQTFESIAANVIAQHLDNDLLNAIHKLKHNSSSCTYAIIDNCPIQVPAETLTPTPYGTDIPDKPNYSAEWFMIGLANLLGKPMGYMQEKNAQLVHQIAPDGRKQTSLSSAGSKFELPPHIEAAALSARPDYLILGCVRRDRENKAITSIYSVDDAVHKITDTEELSLQQASFKHGLPPSFGDYETSRVLNQRASPILQRTMSGHYEANLDMATTEPWLQSDQMSFKAIEKFGNALQKVKLPLLLQEGQVVICNNSRVLHGRSSFQCHGDGKDRWLHRIYVARDLEDKLSSSKGACAYERIFDNGDVKIV